MDYFVKEVLEDKRVIEKLSEYPQLYEKGKCIAEYIKETKDYPHIEPGLLPIYVLGHLAEYALEINLKRGISREVTTSTLKDINIWIANYEMQYGKVGLAEFPWLIYHYTGRLFRLGRLQFQLAVANHNIPAGEFVIETHIPQGESLDIEACMSSFHKASEFYREYFPQYKADYFMCNSWLLNPHLAQMLEKDSNIVRFMKLWTTYDIPSDHSRQAIERVFGFGLSRKDISAAPERTSLQRALKKYLLSGGEMDISEGYYMITKCNIQISKGFEGRK